MAIVGDNPTTCCRADGQDDQRCPAPGGGGEQRPAHRGRAGRTRPVRPAGRTPPRTAGGPGPGSGRRRGDDGSAHRRCQRCGVAGRGDRRRRGGRVDDRAVRPAGRPGDRRLPRRAFALCGHRERMAGRTGPARSRRASARRSRSRWSPGPGSGRPRPRHWSCAWSGGWARRPPACASLPLRRCPATATACFRRSRSPSPRAPSPTATARWSGSRSGSGATVLTFGGAQRRMLPGPVGDLEAARRASGAADVVAYIADPARAEQRDRLLRLGRGRRPRRDNAVAELLAGEGSARPPPSPPKRPGAFWPEPRPARGRPASCSAPPSSPTPPAPR